MSNIAFKNKKVNIERLLSYGFFEKDNGYIYSVDIMGGQFELTVFITYDEQISTKIIDKDTNDEYILHKIPSSCGEFVGAVKAEYETILNDISDKCFQSDVFKSEYARKVISYIRGKYKNELEYLWQRFSDNAVVRRMDNRKWYAVFMVISKAKLGVPDDEIIEILDLRANTEDIESIVDNKRYFRGYHMNKKHWITICLDGSVPIDEIYERLDKSYDIAGKR